MVRREELQARAGGAFPLALPLGPGRGNVEDRQAWRPGDRVRVRDDHVAGVFQSYLTLA